MIRPIPAAEIREASLLTPLNLSSFIFNISHTASTKTARIRRGAMIAILAFVGFDASNLPSMIVGALVVFVPQLAVSVMRPSRAIGGADIKISTALAFLLGAEKGLCAMIIGLTAAVITMLIVRKVKKTGKGEAFPLVPFLAAGAMAVFMI